MPPRIHKATATLPSTRQPVVAKDVVFELPWLHPAQEEFVWAFENYNARFVVAAFGTKGGKTHGSCARVVHEAWTGFNGKLIWWLAPSYAQSENAYIQIKRMLPRDTFKEEKAKLAIQLLNPSGGLHSRIEFKSGEKGDNLRGFGVHFLVVDEYCRCKREAIISAMTTQLKTKGRAMYLSTPKGHDDFYNEFRKGDKSKLLLGQLDPHPDYISFRMPSWVNPTLPEGTIDDMRRNMPRDVFRQECEAEFIDGATSVFRGARDCIRDTPCPMEPEKGRRYVIGADLARIRDFTVIICMDAESKHVVYFDRFHENSWDYQVSRIAAVSRKYNNAMVVVDATSIGEAPSQKLAEIVPTIQFKTNSNQAKRELVEKLRLSIEQRVITFPPIQVLVDELDDFEMEISPSGTVTYSAPRGKFDDAAMALALCNWQLTQAQFKWKFKRVRL